jgi:putative sterol carrier protein
MNSIDLQESLVAMAKTHPLGATIALKLTDGDTLYLKSIEGEVMISTDEMPNVMSTFVLSSTDLADMLSKKLDPTRAFMSGKMQVKGDMGIAMKLAQVMSL